MAEARAIPSLGGFDEEFVNAVEEDWQCAICQLPLKDPMLTKCGHRFCRQCLDEHFRRLQLARKRLSCPVDRNNLVRDKDIFPDKAAERKILSFIMKCPSQGCQWTGELRSKDNHLATCPLKVVSCTNKNCHVTLTRNKLQEHVTTTCPWRIIRCPHCNASHAECKTLVHQAECKRFPLNCPQSCGAVIPREEISTHTEKDCPLTIISCPYAHMSCTTKISTHTEKDCPLTIISCPYAHMSCTTKIQRRELENHLQTAVRLHLDLACVKLNATQVRLSKTQADLTNTQVELTNTQVQLTDAREEFKAMTGKLEEKFKETTKELEEKYNVVKKMIQCSEEHNYFKWKISGFSEALRKAKTEENTVIYSEPFYRYGYKFRLRLLPNGFGIGENTHLTISINIMKGEDDDILPWPFHKNVMYTLIDQQEDATDRANIVITSITDPENPEIKMCFAKPVTDQNIGCGCLTFASHNKLKERRYIVDDTIIIKVQFCPPQ